VQGKQSENSKKMEKKLSKHVYNSKSKSETGLMTQQQRKKELETPVSY